MDLYHTNIFYQCKYVSKYLFANEKKIHNEIKYITETKYI